MEFFVCFVINRQERLLDYRDIFVDIYKSIISKRSLKCNLSLHSFTKFTFFTPNRTSQINTRRFLRLFYHVRTFSSTNIIFYYEPGNPFVKKASNYSPTKEQW